MKKKVFLIGFRRISRDNQEEFELFEPENPDNVAIEWSRLHPNDHLASWGEPEFPDDIKKSIEHRNKFWGQFKDI